MSGVRRAKSTFRTCEDVSAPLSSYDNNENNFADRRPAEGNRNHSATTTKIELMRPRDAATKGKRRAKHKARTHISIPKGLCP